MARNSANKPQISRGSRLREALLASPRPIHILLVVICMMLGIALVTQVRAQRADPLDQMTEQDLVVLLDELSGREETLRGEKAELESELADLENAVSQQQAADEAARKSVEQARINAGTVPVEGEVLTMIVTDPQGGVNAVQFVMTLGELRNAGAEAVSINGIRANAQTWFSMSDVGIIMNGQVIHSPYQWKVIGDSDTIATALEISAGAAWQMRSKNADVEIIKSQQVVIDEVVPTPIPQYATEK